MSFDISIQELSQQSLSTVFVFVLFYYVDLPGNYIVFSSSTCPEAYTVPLNKKLAIKRKLKNSYLFTERAELWKTYIFQIQLISRIWYHIITLKALIFKAF